MTCQTLVKTVRFFETSDSLNPATRRHISEVSNLRLNAVRISSLRILPIAGPHSEGQTKAQCFRTRNLFHCLAAKCPSVGQTNWAAPVELLVMLMEFHMERFSWAEQSELNPLKFYVTEQVTVAWRSAPEIRGRVGGGWGVRGFSPRLRCTDAGANVLRLLTAASFQLRSSSPLINYLLVLRRLCPQFWQCR